MAVVLVVALLIEGELLRAVKANGPAEIRIRKINAFVMPLLVAVALILILRFLELLA